MPEPLKKRGSNTYWLTGGQFAENLNLDFTAVNPKASVSYSKIACCAVAISVVMAFSDALIVTHHRCSEKKGTDVGESACSSASAVPETKRSVSQWPVGRK